MRYCKKCGNEIPEGRLKVLPNTTTCVKCSDVQAKVPVTVSIGKGDDNYNEIVILEREQFDEYKALETNHRNRMSKVEAKPKSE